MKEGWEYKKLGDICSITDFVSNGSFASLKENVKYYNSPNYAVLVRLADASNGFDKSKLVYTDEHGYNFSKKSHLHGGELIMSNVGSVGSMFICPVMKQPMTLAPNTISITSQNNRFLYYYFLSDGFKAKLKGITSSTTLKKFNKTNFKLLEICIPSLSEQQSIVDYLDSAFAKIDAMKANAEKALNEAKALFQASLKEMLEPKEGWEESELKDIVDEKCPISYGIVQQGDHVEGGIPVVRPVDLNRKYITANGLKCTTESISSSYKRTILRGDEILLGVRGTTGIIGIATEELNGCNVNRGVVPLFFKDTICRDFIFYEMLSPAIQAVFAEKTTGATLKQINIKDLRTIVFSYPIIEIQQSIVETLDSLKSKVDRLQANYDKISQECDALKQAILRQVFE